MSETKGFELTPSISIIIAGAVIAGAIVFTNMSSTAPATGLEPQQPTAGANVSAPSVQDHIVGSPSAPIVLIEYSDFECPFCSLVHPTIKRIVSESNGQIAWIYRHFPLESIHPEARPSAIASECVAEQLGNDGFFAFADALFADQNKLSSQYYAQLAAELGADRAAFSACVASDKFAQKIDAQAQEAMKNGGQGTPFTIVYGNGVQVPASGALPYEQFMSVINGVKSRQ